MSAVRRMPAAWETDLATDLSGDYEWIPLRLPPELTRVRLCTDGSRRVLLRRRKIRVDGLRPADQPGL